MTKRIFGRTVSIALLLFALLFAVFGAGFTAARAEEYTYPVLEETSPFAGVRVTGINQRVQNILGTGSEKGVVNAQGVQLYKHLWSVEGKPSGIVNLNLAVEVSDWSNASAMRIRIKSNKLPEANANAQDNNIAIGYGVKSATTDKIVLKMDKPYSGGVSFNKQNGDMQSSLYFINDQIPYFSMGRQMNTYVTANLDDKTFGNLTDYVQSTPNGDTWYTLYDKNEQENIFDYVGEYDLEDPTIYTGKTDKDGNKLVNDSPVDMTQVKFVFIRFEPQNYANMCLDVGDVEILVDGEWITAVDMSKAQIAQKESGETWYDAITGMSANQCMLDPNYESGATTEAFRMETIEATPCGSHADANGDGYCDRCFAAVPHLFIDVLPIGNKDGLCDTCGLAVCGEDKCVDANGDGGCDVCGHTDYVEQPEPEPGSEPGTDGADDGSNGNQSETTDDGGEGGCNSAIGAGSLVLAAGAVSVSLTAARKKRK